MIFHQSVGISGNYEKSDLENVLMVLSKKEFDQLSLYIGYIILPQ